MESTSESVAGCIRRLANDLQLVGRYDESVYMNILRLMVSRTTLQITSFAACHKKAYQAITTSKRIVGDYRHLLLMMDGGNSTFFEHQRHHEALLSALALDNFARDSLDRFPEGETVCFPLEHGINRRHLLKSKNTP
jgi:hypothetical protein